MSAHLRSGANGPDGRAAHTANLLPFTIADESTADLDVALKRARYDAAVGALDDDRDPCAAAKGDVEADPEDWPEWTDGVADFDADAFLDDEEALAPRGIPFFGRVG